MGANLTVCLVAWNPVSDMWDVVTDYPLPGRVDVRGRVVQLDPHRRGTQVQVDTDLLVEQHPHVVPLRPAVRPGIPPPAGRRHRVTRSARRSPSRSVPSGRSRGPGMSAVPSRVLG